METLKKEKANNKTDTAQEAGTFAVIATGGKQYKVAAGDTVKIEKMAGDYKAGDKLTFDKVLLVEKGTDTAVGTPYVEGTVVTGTISEICRDKTIDVIKYKQKSRYFKKYGHRQPHFKVKIDLIK